MKKDIISGSDKGNFFERLKNAFIKGWRGPTVFTLFLIGLWPFWVVMGTPGYGIRRNFKRKRK